MTTFFRGHKYDKIAIPRPIRRHRYSPIIRSILLKTLSNLKIQQYYDAGYFRDTPERDTDVKILLNLLIESVARRIFEVCGYQTIRKIRRYKRENFHEFYNR